MLHGRLDQQHLERLVYRALDGSDDLVLVLEQQAMGQPREWTVAAANGAFCRASGYTHTELADRPLRALAAPGADASDWDAAMQAVQDGRSYRTELLFASKSGGDLWLGLHLMPVPQESHPCGVVLGRDITAVRQERRQQAAIQGLLAKVFVAVQTPVCIVDDGSAIMMVNPACETLFGHPPGALIGRKALDLIAPEQRATIRQLRERHLATGQPYRCQTAVVLADGSEIPVELFSSIVERDDLKRFRIISCMPLAQAAPAGCTVHVAGKIRLIGLEEVKATLGPRWPEVATRVMSSAEHVVRRRCGPRDTWTRTRDSGFLICFGDATEDEAALRAASIAREIRNRLIGEGEQSQAAEVSAIAKAISLPSEPAMAADLLSDTLEDRLKTHLSAIEQQARDTLAHAAKFAECELRPIHGVRSAQVAGYFASLSAELERRLLCAYSALPAHDRHSFDLDRFMLGAAADQAIAKMAQGSGVPVYVGVDFTTFLDRRSTQRYLELCARLDPRLRDALILVIGNLPRGVPRSRMLECTTRLRPYCRAVAFESESFEPPPVEASTLGSSIVVVNDLLSATRGADNIAALERLLGLVHAHAGRVLVRGATTLDRARRLKAAGVDFICFAPS